MPHQATRSPAASGAGPWKLLMRFWKSAMHTCRCTEGVLRSRCLRAGCAFLTSLAPVCLQETADHDSLQVSPVLCTSGMVPWEVHPPHNQEHKLTWSHASCNALEDPPGGAHPVAGWPQIGHWGTQPAPSRGSSWWLPAGQHLHPLTSHCCQQPAAPAGRHRV